ncbi:hypothetical protein E2C01_015591 [Portunus trituberculatus]|uniref:Uncharacterized protein n=1 Tax=Portunus trituberculatus TaxID=210409 RepID=A0A5B7DNH6_PORTR|nr:hypothetical protein [Portunus trituberculatus]
MLIFASLSLDVPGRGCGQGAELASLALPSLDKHLTYLLPLLATDAALRVAAALLLAGQGKARQGKLLLWWTLAKLSRRCLESCGVFISSYLCWSLLSPRRLTCLPEARLSCGGN